MFIELYVKPSLETFIHQIYTHHLIIPLIYQILVLYDYEP
jgi:hypothetical protein